MRSRKKKDNRLYVITGDKQEFDDLMRFRKLDPKKIKRLASTGAAEGLQNAEILVWGSFYRSRVYKFLNENHLLRSIPGSPDHFWLN